MRLQVTLMGIFLICLIFEIDTKTVCTPELRFKHCKATNNKENPMWDLPYHTNIVFDLELNPYCRNSRVKIQWKLFELESGNLLEEWALFANKIRAVVSPRSLRLGEYVVTATATEKAMHKITGNSTAECWFKISGRRSTFAGEARMAHKFLINPSSRIMCRKNCRETTGTSNEISVNPMNYMIFEFHLGIRERNKATYLMYNFRWGEKSLGEEEVTVTGYKLRNRVYKREVKDATSLFGKKKVISVCVEKNNSCIKFTKYKILLTMPNMTDRGENKRKDRLDFLEEGTVWKKKFAVDRAHTQAGNLGTRQRMLITYQASGYPISYMVMDFHENEAKNSTFYLIGIRDAKVEFHDYLVLNFVIIPHYNTKAEDPPYPYDYKIAPYKPNDDSFIERLKFATALYGLTSSKYKKLLIPGGPKKLLSTGRIDEGLDMIHTLLFLLNCDNSLPGSETKMDQYYDLLKEIHDDLIEIAMGVQNLAEKSQALLANLYHIMKISASMPRLKIPEGIDRQLFIAKKQHQLVSRITSANMEYFWQMESANMFSPKDRPMRYNDFYINIFYNPLLLAMDDILGKNFVLPPVVFNEPASSINPHQKVLAEDYPDYGDYLDDSTRAECTEITVSTIKLFRIFAFNMGTFYPFGEPEIKNTTKYTDIYHFVEENVRMVHSLDFVLAEVKFTMQPLINIDLYSDETIGFIIAVKPSAYFWANIRDTFPIVVTYVFIRRIVNFGAVGVGDEYERPSHVSFTYKDDIVKLEHHAFAGLGSDRGSWSVAQINTNMIRLRGEVPRNVLLMISIKNFTGFANNTNDRVMVTLMDTKYPKFPDHFKTNTSDRRLLLVYTDSTSVHFYRHKGTARFIYLAIVPTNAPFVDAQTEATPLDRMEQAPSFPSKQLLQFDEYQNEGEKEDKDETGEGKADGGEADGLGFDLAVAVYQCLTWNEDEEKFDHSDDCTIPEGIPLAQNSIKCACAGPGVLLPEVRNVRVIKLNVTKIHFELKFQVNWSVFIVTFVAFFLYCLLLIVATTRLRPVLNLCYLGDNLKADRNAYLIVVRTKDVPEAGTTSNVMMKVHGRSTNSKSFVLNYPDPDRRLLQMACEDAFILTTEEHLGRLRYIEVWTDVFGFRPGWKCESIRIYDLRRNKEYYFDVQDLFSLRDDAQCYKKLPPTRQDKLNVTPKEPFDSFAFHFGPLHTFNVLDSSRDFELHYICRITLVLSHVINTLAFTLFLEAFPTMSLRDCLGFNPFTSFWRLVSYVFIIAAVANVPNFLISIVFRNSSYYGLLRYRTGPLPGFVTVIAWIVLVSMISFGMIYLILCGWWLAAIAVPGFLVISALGLLVDIFIYEYLLISIYNFATIKSRFSIVDLFKGYDLVNIVLEAEQQRRFLYRRISIWGMRPFFKHLYKPLKGEVAKERKHVNQSRYEIRQNLRDGVFLWFLALCVFLLFYLRYESHAAVMNGHMEDLFVYGICSHCTNKTDISDIHKSIYEVRTLEDIYKYLNYTVAFVTMNTTWYDGYIAADPGLIIDFQTKLISVSRVRQVMVGPVDCPDQALSKKLDVTECLPAFDSNTTLKEDEKGKSMHAYQTYDGYSFMHGKMVGTYDGNGYWIKMGRKYRNVVFTVALIKNAVWFTKRTRAVFVELWTYNANTGLFCDVRILFERGPMQYIQASYKIRSVQLGFSRPVLEIFSVAIFIITLFMVFKFAVMVFGRVCVRRFYFFVSLWRLMDAIILVLCIVLLITYISKEYAEVVIIDEMVNTRRNQFVPYFPVFHYVDTIQIMVGLVIFFCIIRVLEIIKYTNRFRINQKIFRKAYAECFSVFALVLVAFFGISLGAVVELVDHPITSGSFGEIMVSHFRIMCGFYNEFSRWIATDCNGPAIYLYYAALGAKVLVLNFLCTITCLRVYKEMKRKLSGLQWNYTLRDFFKEYTYYYSQYYSRTLIKAIWRGMRGGNAEWQESPIMPKEDKYRYEKVQKLSGNNVNLIRLCLLAVLRNTVIRREGIRLRKKDYFLMQEISKAIYDKRHPWYARSGALDDPNQSFYFVVREQAEERTKAKLVRDTVIEEIETTSSYFTTTSILEQKRAIMENTQIMVPDLLSLGRMETILKSLMALDQLFENITVDVSDEYEIKSSKSALDELDESSSDSEYSGDEYEEEEGSMAGDRDMSDEWSAKRY